MPAFDCEQCQQLFDTRASLRKHLVAVNHGWKCPLCPNKDPFAIFNALNTHFSTKHTTSRLHSCHSCFAAFDDAAALAVHNGTAAHIAALAPQTASANAPTQPEPSPPRQDTGELGRAPETGNTDRPPNATSSTPATQDDPPRGPANNVETTYAHPQNNTQDESEPVRDEASRTGGSASPLPSGPADIERSSQSSPPSRFVCRVCACEPIDPTTTMCGHLFCHSCIVAEISKSLKCPVCHTVMLVRLRLD
ncbi:hypothetical protein BDW22DRAFT_1358973 [Trametopsis cervina]|nr:hypothetical protein BDW22DRAFT_1358973 [Trametopsis cervina]